MAPARGLAMPPLPLLRPHCLPTLTAHSQLSHVLCLLGPSLWFSSDVQPFFLPCRPSVPNFPKPSVMVRCSLALSWSLSLTLASSPARVPPLDPAWHLRACLLQSLHCFAQYLIQISVHNARAVSRLCSYVWSMTIT